MSLDEVEIMREYAGIFLKTIEEGLKTRSTEINDKVSFLKDQPFLKKIYISKIDGKCLVFELSAKEEYQIEVIDAPINYTLKECSELDLGDPLKIKVMEGGGIEIDLKNQVVSIANGVHFLGNDVNRDKLKKSHKKIRTRKRDIKTREVEICGKFVHSTKMDSLQFYPTSVIDTGKDYYIIGNDGIFIDGKLILKFTSDISSWSKESDVRDGELFTQTLLKKVLK